MKKQAIYTISNLPEDKTDLRHARSLTETQINKAAREDADAPLLTARELSQFKRVHLPDEVDVKTVRKKTHLSQEVFAACFGVSRRTLQDWEQGRRHPSKAARVLLTLISRKPRLIQDVLMG